MKNTIKFLAPLVAGASLLFTGCLKETFPQSSTATAGQVSGAPGAFQNYVDACTSTLVGTFAFDSKYAWDFGYPSFFLQRDVMGQDVVCEDSSSEHFSTWYQVSTGLGPRYLVCQAPWTYYYQWINNCNTVISLCGEDPAEEQRAGAGIARAMRAMFYMDLARMFAYTYVGHEDAETVPIVTESVENPTNNPRATNEQIWAFILDDLDKAETLLEGYTRSDKSTPDLSVVYGLKARAYLTIENFPEAEKYAKLAQEGYTPLTADEYIDRTTGFNEPNHAWMFSVSYKSQDPNILENDADTSWGSAMVLEITEDSGCGYASNYGSVKRIDKHLYETIPATDIRKKCYVDPALDAMSESDRTAALADYSDYPEAMDATASATTSGAYGCLSLKFRAGGGDAGHRNQYIGFCISAPLMRVEEMMLIEAEAVGMQAGRESEGRTLLTSFAALRDPSYQYDEFQTFRDNVWWQRRVELWGEGFATFDIKRLNKGITRSYAGTNHPTGYRYNTTGVPSWMNLCIVQSETNYNTACTNNPTPVQPDGDSPEFVW